jgi:hypothetical protein
MSITLGAVPDRLLLNLSTGSPFRTAIARADGLAWDADTVIELGVGHTVWPASIDGLNDPVVAECSAGWRRDRLAACRAVVQRNSVGSWERDA